MSNRNFSSKGDALAESSEENGVSRPRKGTFYSANLSSQAKGEGEQWERQGDFNDCPSEGPLRWSDARCPMDAVRFLHQQGEGVG